MILNSIKKISLMLLLLSLLHCFFQKEKPQSWIRINQIGYLPNSIKVAVLVSKDALNFSNFDVMDAHSNERVWQTSQVKSKGAYGPFVQTFRLDFTQFQKEGKFYLK